MSDSIETKIKNDIPWLHAHLAVLLTIALIAGLVFGGVHLVENLIDSHDARVATAQQKIATVNEAAQAALLAQLAQDHQDNLARDAAQTKLIASLISQMSEQHVATAKLVTTDATLDVQSAAARLATQTKTSPTEITANNNGVLLSLPVTRTVVADLDLLTQSENDVANLQGQVDAQQVIGADTRTELDAANKVIAADKTELVSTVKADEAECVVRVDAQAKKDRKRALWVTIAGFVGGVLLGARL